MSRSIGMSAGSSRLALPRFRNDPQGLRRRVKRLCVVGNGGLGRFGAFKPSWAFTLGGSSRRVTLAGSYRAMVRDDVSGAVVHAARGICNWGAGAGSWAFGVFIMGLPFCAGFTGAFVLHTGVPPLHPQMRHLFACAPPPHPRMYRFFACGCIASSLTDVPSLRMRRYMPNLLNPLSLVLTCLLFLLRILFLDTSLPLFHSCSGTIIRSQALPILAQCQSSSGGARVLMNGTHPSSESNEYLRLGILPPETI
ncbi:hypothetical protein BD779DRAFT_1478998 [Infundibulicybe gibba]|nr:hypothetical protein BD779DRAFT_1478998 [Infundibulicybe gibba]